MYSSETEIMMIGSSLIDDHSFTQLHHTIQTLTLAGEMLINRYFIHKSLQGQPPRLQIPRAVLLQIALIRITPSHVLATPLYTSSHLRHIALVLVEEPASAELSVPI